ncbi:MAG: hypothetical protein WB523_08960 [Candidatus Sulfotelmatobacter sp.]
MATKKKKKTKAKKAASRTASTKKQTRKRKSPKKLAKKKSAKKVAPSNKAVAKRTTSKKSSRGPSRRLNPSSSERETSRSHSGEQAGDMQGLSNVESVDSESVDELMEEGNAFEAGVISGVEDAGRRYDKEVRTREVPEDDVPEEYLDKD